MKKLSTKTALLYVVYTVVALLGATPLDGALSFGAFVGAIYATNPIAVCVIYIGASFVGGLSVVWVAATRAVVVVAFVLLHRILKRKINKTMLLLYMIFANVYYFVHDFGDVYQTFFRVIDVCIGICFAYVSIYVFRAVFVRGINYSLGVDEQVCVAVFGIATFFCLSSVTLWQFEPIYFVIPFAVLFCSSALSEPTAYVCAATAGIGNLFATGKFECCAFCIAVALVAVGISKVSRYVAALSVVGVDVIMSYFFNLHGAFDSLVFVPTAVSVFVFVVVPTSVYKHIKDTTYGGATEYLTVAVSRKISLGLSRKLYRLSDIFLGMRNAFYTVSPKVLTAEEAQHAVVRHVSESVCSECTLRSLCWRENMHNTEKSLLSMTVCATKRGKCTILDVPQSLSLRCERVSSLIAEINDQARSYSEYVTRNEQAGNSRTLIGDQMGGVSGLLLQLASQAKSKTFVDSDKERALTEQLVFHNVMCIGCTVMQQSGWLDVFVTVSSKDVDCDCIEKVASNVLSQPMKVEQVEATDSVDWNVVVLRAKPRFTLNYGVASICKDGSIQSGDTYTVLNTDNGKCIVALCDGMGSGSRAEEMSSAAIDLVESFYRAGFDNDVILTCVNKLLTDCGNEVFCAVDMVAVDLYNGLADFIKLGATSGLVKCGDGVEIVSGSSLPLGVLEEMRPAVTKKALKSGDIVVLFTDGVTDCFRDVNALASLLQQNTLTNAQSIAENFLANATKLCKNKPADDMTVLVAKIC